MADAVEAYLAIQPSSKQAPATVEHREWRAKMIIAGLGRKRLSKVTVIDCDRFLSEVAVGTFGRRTINRDGVRRTRSLLVGVLNNEVRLSNLLRNVAEYSVLPEAEHFKQATSVNEDGDEVPVEARRSLTFDELGRLWRVARMPLLVAVDLCGRNGLRPSEARALRWKVIDIDAGRLTINRQMSGSDRLTKPKTKRSRRTIAIDDQTCEVLLGWRAHQKAKQTRAGDRWSNDRGLVITTRYGTPINRRNLARMVEAACNDAGLLGMVPYELRHTAITLQLEAGHETWRVADWAGTSERMIEEIYRHRLSRVSDLGPVRLEASGLGPGLGPIVVPESGDRDPAGG